MEAAVPERATWSVWIDGDGLKAKCSTCGQEIDMALVFPDHGLKICFGCLGAMHVAVDVAKKDEECCEKKESER